jgi:S1-C subfamily serine protease
VLPGAASDDAGLRSGDELLALNVRTVSALEDARSSFEGAIGSTIFVRFHRGIFTHTTKLTLHTVM